MQERFWNEDRFWNGLTWWPYGQGAHRGMRWVRPLSSAKDRTEKVNYWKIFEAGMGTHSGQQVNARMPGAWTREPWRTAAGKKVFRPWPLQEWSSHRWQWLLQQTENRRPDMLKGWQGWHHFLRSIPDLINHKRSGLQITSLTNSN